MPDVRGFTRSLRPYRERMRIAACAGATLLAAGNAGLVLVGAWLLGVNASASWIASSATFAIILVSAASVWWTRCTFGRVAAAIERETRRTDNVVITAEEIAGGKCRMPHPLVATALYDGAALRLAEAPATRVQPLVAPITLATGSVIAVVVLGLALPKSSKPVLDGVAGGSTSAAAPLASGELRIVVTSPDYAKRPVTDALNPTSMTVLEGSRVRLETAGGESTVTLIDGEARTPFTAAAGVVAMELVATSSRALIVRRESANSSADRLFYLHVDADERPSVRIARPAQDLVFPAPVGQVPIEIEARDDVGLRSVALKYTVVSGSGEAFTFKEGEWPVDVARSSAAEWRAGAQLSLAALNLQDGDTVVYRAIAGDAKPGADAGSSQTYLIEIGQLGGVASTGFALPEDLDRQGLSQQMLIIKTERLHATRTTLSKEALVEQSRLLAVEQRMVKAEFVFMTGGEVADEVEEATSAHELAEGRLENSAQAELLTAIREMSRAEARLNDGDTTQALTFERAALAALQRAFDRRRYLLRTLPERARIDVTRRLTGDLAAARSSSHSTAPSPIDPVVGSARELLRELRSARAGEGSLSPLASRIIAIEPSSEALQKAAMSLASANDRAARDAAVREVERALLHALLQRLPPTAGLRLRSHPVAGRLVQEVRRQRVATP